MFGMLPFERSEDNVFDTFDNFARNFFRSSNTNLPAFRTDIRDAGDKFILEAELPGFDKGDIKLDVKDGILTITAEHSEKQDQKDDKGTYIRRGAGGHPDLAHLRRGPGYRRPAGLHPGLQPLPCGGALCPRPQLLSPGVD